jgi:hypothetical protein
MLVILEKEISPDVNCVLDFCSWSNYLFQKLFFNLKNQSMENVIGGKLKLKKPLEGAIKSVAQP